MAVTHLKNKGSKIKRMPSFENGGKVEKEFDTIRGSGGAKTLIRKGMKADQIPYAGKGRALARKVGEMHGEQIVADIMREGKTRIPNVSRYEDDE